MHSQASSRKLTAPQGNNTFHKIQDSVSLYTSTNNHDRLTLSLAAFALGFKTCQQVVPPLTKICELNPGDGLT